MRKRWWIIGSAVVLLTAGAIGLTMMKPEQAMGQPVSFGAVSKATLESQVLTSGVVTVEDEIRLYANVSGTLRDFVVKEGDVVKKGQLIARIDTSDVESRILELDAQIELQRANLAKTQAGTEPEELAQAREKVYQEERSLETAKREYERVSQLFQSGATTSQEVEKAKAQLDAAVSSLNVAKQQLALRLKGPRKEELQSIQAQINKFQVEKAQLEKERVQSVLVAPADGTVIAVAADNGQYVNKGTEILTLADLNRVLIKAEVNESDVSKIKLGQLAVIEGSSLGKSKLQAKVTKIAPIAVTTQSSSGQGEKTRVKVTLAPTQPAAILKPGFHVDVNISVEKIENALQVPIEAVQQEANGDTYVWVTENGTARKRKIVVGMENELFSQVKSGLTGNEQVILNPPETLQENQPVTESKGPIPPGM